MFRVYRFGILIFKWERGDRVIKFTANIRSARAETDDAITTSSVGIPVSLHLSSDFDGLAKTAVFRCRDLSVDVVIPGDATEITLPGEVLTAGAQLHMGVYAANAAGDVVIPTVWAVAGYVQRGAIPSGVDPSEPTPSWVAQVQQIASEALETADSVRADADAGRFDGEQGPQGIQGLTGPTGPQGEKGDTGAT